MAKATNKDLVEVVYAFMRDSSNPAQLAEAIAAYLITEHQTKEVDRIMREVERLRYERDGHLEIITISKHNVSPEAKEAMKQIFTAKNSTIIEHRDKDLVGGVSIQALDKWLDLSIRGRLRQLKNSNVRG